MSSGRFRADAVARVWAHGRAHAGRLVMLLVAAATVGGAVLGSASAQSPGGGGSTVPGLPAGLDAASLPFASAQAREALAREVDRVRAKAEQREEELAEPAAVQEREESKDAYEDLSGAQARDLLEQQFGRLLDGAQWDGSQIARQDGFVRFVDDYTASIEVPGVGRRLAVSSAPLRRETGDGKEPVELTLRQESGGYEPQNPLTELHLPERADGDVSLGRAGVDVKLETPGGTAASQASRVDPERLVYPEVDTDTDHVLAPTIGGFESFVQLRSEDSPETVDYRFSLPDGATLRASSAGGAEVVRDAKRIARVGRPAATDAQGRDVPIAVEVEGDRLRLTVRHRDQDFSMPILVDPIFEDYWTSGNNWYNGEGLDRLASDWFFVESTPGGFAPRTACDPAVAGSCYGSGRGLQIYAAPGSYAAGQWGGWVYSTTPGRTSYIAEAHYGWLWHNRHADAANNSNALAWLYNSTTQTFTGIDVLNSELAGGYDLVQWGDGGGVAADGPGTNMTSWSLQMPTAATRTAWTDVYAGGVFLVLDDPEPPTAAAPSHSVPVTGWHGNGEDITTTASATDPGLGVKHLNLTRSYAAIDQKTHACAGTRSSPCPAEWNQQFTYSTSQMNEGTNNLHFSAYDPPLHLSSLRSWSVKVDRSGPEVALSGALWDQRAQPLEPGQHALRVDASDGSAASPRSGVKSIEIKIDGAIVSGPSPETCPDGQCPYTLGRDWTFDTSQFSPSMHTVQVIAKDLLGHTKTESFEVRGSDPRAGDLPYFSFEEWELSDRMSLRVNVANGNLLVDTSDLSIAGTGLDLDIGRAYNSLSAGGGSVGAGWSLANAGDVRIYDHADASVTYHGPSGYAVDFDYLPGAGWEPWSEDNIDPYVGSFSVPSGLRMAMHRLSNTTFELVDDATGERLFFTSSGRGSWGRLTRQADLYGNQITYAYNTGRLSSITDTQGRTVTVNYNPQGKIDTLTDWTGRDVHYAYNQGRLETYTDSADKQTIYGYDTSGRLNSITSPAGRVTRITYQPGGRVASVIQTTDAAHTTGPTTTFDYATGGPCASGQAKTIVADPEANGSNGHTTTLCSDDQGRVLKSIDAEGHTTSSTYTAQGQLASVARPGGGVTNYAYNQYQDPVCIQRGATTVQNCQSGTTGLKTTFEYANTDYLTWHFPTRVTDPDTGAKAYCYNGATPTCGEAGTTGPTGSLKSDTNALTSQNTRHYEYDANGSIKKVTDARGGITTYGYDAAGNLRTRTPPPGTGLEPWTFESDDLSRVESTVDGNDDTETVTFDELDRPTTMSYGGGPSFSYVRNDDGDLLTSTDPGGTTTQTIDDLRRITRETFPGNIVNDYGYDKAGNLTTLTDSGGATHYTYNGLNQLTTVTEPNQTEATTFSYNVDGARTRMTYPSDVSVNWDYLTASGRIDRVRNLGATGDVLKSFDYDYAPAGTSGENTLPQRVTEQTGATSVDVLHNYYDAIGRLRLATTPLADRSYEYRFDGNGNLRVQIITERGHGHPHDSYYAYDDANLPCWRASGDDYTGSPCAPAPSAEAVTYSHDANGNDDLNPQQGFTYNSARQPATTTSLGSTAQLAYRGSGQDELIREGNNVLEQSMLGILGITGPTGTTRYTRAPDGTLITQRLPGGQQRNFLYDAEASVIGLTDDAGALVTSYTYQPYGRLNADPAPDDANPFMYRGEYATLARPPPPGIAPRASHTGGGGGGGASIAATRVGARPRDYVDGRHTQTCNEIPESVPTHLHHTVPREILKLLPEAVANHPLVRGRRGAPNRWPVPVNVHKEIHRGPGGGQYNQSWKDELDALDGEPTVQDILDIRETLTRQYRLTCYNPQP